MNTTHYKYFRTKLLSIISNLNIASWGLMGFTQKVHAKFVYMNLTVIVNMIRYYSIMSFFSYLFSSILFAIVLTSFQFCHACYEDRAGSQPLFDINHGPQGQEEGIYVNVTISPASAGDGITIKIDSEHRYKLKDLEAMEKAWEVKKLFAKDKYSMAVNHSEYVVYTDQDQNKFKPIDTSSHIGNKASKVTEPMANVLNQVQQNALTYVEKYYKSTYMALQRQGIPITDVERIKKLTLNLITSDVNAKNWLCSSEAELRDLSCVSNHMIEICRQYYGEQIKLTPDEAIMCAHVGACIAIVNLGQIFKVNPYLLLDQPMYNDLYNTITNNK